MAPRFSSKQLSTFIATSRGKSYTVTAITAVLIIILVLVGVYPAISAILNQYSEKP